MASRYEVEATFSSALDLKNVNWRHGSLKPYVVVWIDPKNKLSTRVDEDGDVNPSWDQTLTIPLPPDYTVNNSVLCIDVVHAGGEEGTKPLIGSGQLLLEDVVGDVGFGERANRTLHLKRPSGRPQGRFEIKVTVKEIIRYRAPETYYPPPYGVAAPPAPAYGSPYAAAPPAYGAPYSSAPPPAAGYGAPYSSAPAPVAGYGAPYSSAPPPAAAGYGAPYSTAPPPAAAYGGAPYAAGYGAPYGETAAQQQQQAVYAQGEQKKSKFGGMGVGTGLAVGAVAGALGGLALAEGFNHMEDAIAERAAEKVEEDLEEYGDDEY